MYRHEGMPEHDSGIGPGKTCGLLAVTVVGSPSRVCMLVSRWRLASNRSRSMPGTISSITRWSSSLFCRQLQTLLWRCWQKSHAKLQQRRAPTMHRGWWGMASLL